MDSSARRRTAVRELDVSSAERLTIVRSITCKLSRTMRPSELLQPQVAGRAVIAKAVDEEEEKMGKVLMPMLMRKTARRSSDPRDESRGEKQNDAKKKSQQ